MKATQNECGPQVAARTEFSSGERGIRTLGNLAATPVFETGPINHSGISPGRGIIAAAAGCEKVPPAAGTSGREPAVAAGVERPQPVDQLDPVAVGVADE